MNKEKLVLYKENGISYVKKHWKSMLLFFIVILMYLCCFYFYNRGQKLPISKIADTSPNLIAQAQLDIGTFQSLNDAKDVSRAIEQRIIKPSDVTFITNTQQEADKKANTIAKSDSADYVLLKQTEQGNNSGSNTTGQGNIVNNYYGVHLEKNNKIKAGITVNDGKVYEDLAYQHNKTEVIIHMQPDSHPVKGATVMKTIKEW